MLRPAARRKALQRYLRQSSQQLHLPWLCPAIATPVVRQARSTQTLSRTSTKPLSPSPSPRFSRTPQSRELASAATDSLVYPADDQYVPFSGSDPFTTSPFSPTLFDPTKILMLENAIPVEQTRLRRSALGESGTVATEIQPTFEACLHVGRFERAEGLLDRLAQAFDPTAEEFQRSNRQYIQALLQSLEINRRQDEYKRMVNWIRKGMSKIGLPKDPTAHAALLRGAFLILDGTARTDTVRKCWSEVVEHKLEAQVVGTQALRDEDLGQISEICPTKVKGLDEIVESERRAQSQLSNNLDTEVTINSDADVATAPEPSESVRSVDQVGLGLRYLQHSLKDLSYLPEIEEKSWLTTKEKEEYILRQRQEHLEIHAVDTALERWREERAGEGHSDSTKRMGPYLYEWQKQLTDKIQKELKLVDEAEHKKRKSPTDQMKMEYGPFLRLVSPDRLAGVTIITFLSLLGKPDANFEMKLSNMMVRVGRAAHMEALVSSVMQNANEPGDKGKEAKALTRFISTTRKNEGERALWKVQRRLRHENSTTETSSLLSKTLWSNITYAKVGSVLVQLLTDTAKVQVEAIDPGTKERVTAHQPAFERTSRFELGKRVTYLKLHKKVQHRLLKDPTPAYIVKQLPMLCQPKSWSGFLDGGYYKTSVPVIRVKNAVDRQRRYIEVAASRGDLDNFFAGLDVLGRTSWKINQNVYKVMLEAWNSGKPIANLAPADITEPAPERPAEVLDVAAKRRFKSDQLRWENQKTGLHSERCFQNLQMEMAQNFLHEKFYLPHNADFRGRAYPIAPYLNQMGADNARGLLLFGEGKALGSEGLRWLKIHLANVFGFDKASLRERELFAMDHLEDIRDSVTNPLNGRKWWLEAEDAWQCLATCFELQQALDSPDPEQYISHLPVHQDGSCNGLQHYAALGGDKSGAEQVNLEPGDRPSDVYTGVAELIKAEIAKEAAQGRKIAQYLNGKIKRKIVKQTVMTNVYGVTYIGAMRQVRKQLESHYPEMVQRGNVPISGVCASYIAKKIFNALGTIFNGAHNIQFWLGDCASRISASLTPEQVQVICEKADSKKVRGNTEIIKSLKTQPEKFFQSGVTWTTPLNLTVVQPYREEATTVVKTALQSVAIKDPQETDTIDKRRQLQAFPPNFVHSLDATHMILSALKCDAAGMSFSAVHDSFWTHAASVNDMSRHLRDAFVQMHSEDIIGRLATEFKLRYSRHLFRATIKSAANPLRTKIVAWRRRFKADNPKMNKADRSLAELKMEAKRQELLRSEDAKEKLEGQRMVTPASIFEEIDGDQYLQTQKSLGETALGHIPEQAPSDVIQGALNPETTEELTDVDMEQSIAPIMDTSANASHSSLAAQASPTPSSDLVVPPPATLRQQVLQDLSVPNDRELTAEEASLVAMIEEARNDLNLKEAAKLAEKQADMEKRKLEGVRSSVPKDGMHIWLPLRFAEVPKRGEWDVRRLRESEYFFS